MGVNLSIVTGASPCSISQWIYPQNSRNSPHFSAAVHGWRAAERVHLGTNQDECCVLKSSEALDTKFVLTKTYAQIRKDPKIKFIIKIQKSHTLSMIIHHVPMFLCPKLVIMMFQKNTQPGRIPIRPGPGPGISRQHRLREDLVFCGCWISALALLDFMGFNGILLDFCGISWNGTNGN